MRVDKIIRQKKIEEKVTGKSENCLLVKKKCKIVKTYDRANFGRLIKILRRKRDRIIRKFQKTLENI